MSLCCKNGYVKQVLQQDKEGVASEHIGKSVADCLTCWACVAPTALDLFSCLPTLLGSRCSPSGWANFATRLRRWEWLERMLFKPLNSGCFGGALARYAGSCWLSMTKWRDSCAPNGLLRLLANVITTNYSRLQLQQRSRSLTFTLKSSNLLSVLVCSGSG